MADASHEQENLVILAFYHGTFRALSRTMPRATPNARTTLQAQGHAQLEQLLVLTLVAVVALAPLWNLGHAAKELVAGTSQGEAQQPQGQMPALGSARQAALGWVKSVSAVLQRRHGPVALVTGAKEFPIEGDQIIRGRVRQYDVTGLPWWEHLQNKDPREARRIQVVDRGARQIRHRVTDSPFREDGSFTRTVEIEDVLYRNAPAPSAPRAEDAPYIFSAKRMGPRFNAETGELGLRVFAPRHDVSLVLHAFGNVPEEHLPMRMDHAGVWEHTLQRDPRSLTGRAYSFSFRDRVTGETHLVADPYAHGVTEDVQKSRIVDLRYAWQSPQKIDAPIAERVTFETHVRDLTADPSAPFADELRGSYTAAADPRVTNMARGGAVELMPIHEFDPFFGGHWGYSTTDFFSPSLRYAVDAAHHPKKLGTEQQFMELIDAHRAQGQPVILDVVYNHTSNDPRLYFQVAGKDIYYRIELDESGNSYLRNGSGTGNEFASEHPMARKLIVDSLQHFVEHYRVDGFRFDLGALIDIPTLREIDRVLPKHVFLTMEPWSWQHARFGKDILSSDALKNTRWTAWNDDARDLFEHVHRHGLTDTRDIWELQKVITGSVADSPTSPGQKPGFTSRPSQSVNPVGTHDEGALAHNSSAERMAMTATLGITSQGIPLLQPLMSALHTKQGIANTWNLDNEVNWLNWTQRERHQALENYIAELAEFRASHSHFHYDRPLTDRDIQWLAPTDANTGIGYRIEPSRKTGSQAPLVVLFNFSPDDNALARYTLPEGDWNVLFDGETLRRPDPAARRTAQGEYVVRPGTAVILEKR